MKDPGREAWFDELYNRYHRAVFAYLLTRVDRRETAKDLLQEVFLRVWHQVHVARELGLEASRHWVYRIARNLVIDYYRRRATRDLATREAVRETAEREMVAASAADIVEAKEQTRRVEQSIRRLPEELYQVFVLRYIGEMNSTEIGDMLGLPAGTVRYRLSVARELLRRELDGEREMGKERKKDGVWKQDIRRKPATEHELGKGREKETEQKLKREKDTQRELSARHKPDTKRELSARHKPDTQRELSARHKPDTKREPGKREGVGHG